MKRLFPLMLVVIIIIAACNSSELSISEIQSVPNKIQALIDTDYILQSIYDSDKDNTYIIFHSTETVTAELEKRENILNIKLDSVKQEGNALKQYVYKITRGDAEYDTVIVLVNGKPTPFDNSTGF